MFYPIVFCNYSGGKTVFPTAFAVGTQLMGRSLSGLLRAYCALKQPTATFLRAFGALKQQSNCHAKNLESKRMRVMIDKTCIGV